MDLPARARFDGQARAPVAKQFTPILSINCAERCCACLRLRALNGLAGLGKICGIPIADSGPTRMRRVVMAGRRVFGIRDARPASGIFGEGVR
ncbi:MAG TPA: hypothetical protein VG894_09825 [Bauldia sp.]|nr:hypothetical protein [Bauldia sp.]